MYFDLKKTAILVIILVIVFFTLLHFCGQSETRKEEGTEALLVTFKNYVLIIAKDVENKVIFGEIFDGDDCMNIIDSKTEFEYCRVSAKDENNVTIELKGSETGRFKGYYCSQASTKDMSSCVKVK